MSNTAVKVLEERKQQLIQEKAKMNDLFDNQINELEVAIESVLGKTVWDMPRVEIYDDENPNYIKSSQEEI